ncbi:hypothetical protein ACERZ8_21410 [Tateyamaria armeniaca]|uniref:HipA N-terminal subdomain 1 domain-containing protein n=1 Tax=Tateyamaria armeniaca TaxID=2518930 RepID=A0ABW8V330_9RHOB
MARQISCYTLQIGTQFDGGRNLIWSLLADPSLAEHGVVVPRPKHYRDQLAARVAAFDGTPATTADLNEMLGLDQQDPNRDLHFVLRIVELMQPPRISAPQEDWFYELVHALRITEASLRLRLSPCDFAVQSGGDVVAGLGERRISRHRCDRP